jgi:hypothetical protein
MRDGAIVASLRDAGTVFTLVPVVGQPVVAALDHRLMSVTASRSGTGGLPKVFRVVFDLRLGQEPDEFVFVILPAMMRFLRRDVAFDAGPP